MKTAIFYDLENIGLASRNGEFEEAFYNLQEKIKSSELVGKIVLQKAYLRKTHHNLDLIASVLKKHRAELVIVEPMSTTPKKKANIVDFKMGVDVIATIAKKRSIQTVAVASGDSDFGFLCQQIKEMGRKLLVASHFPTTGKSLLQLCDDWVPLSTQIPATQKVIGKIIDTRIIRDYTDMAFFDAFEDFLSALDSDLLIRRYIMTFGFSLQLFIPALHSRNICFPDYTKLGFPSVTPFVITLLHSAGFEVKEQRITYQGKRNPISPTVLLGHMVNLPPNYSREKLFQYYEVVASIEDIDELLSYIKFMKQSGMLQENSLCPKRTFRATIRKHLGSALEEAGFSMDKSAIAEIEKTL